MYMENRLLLLYFILFLGCNNHPKKDDRCEYTNTNSSSNILFNGFKKLKINKIVFQNFKDTFDKYEYNNPEFDFLTNKERSLRINSNTAKLIQDGCFIIIDNYLKYRITEIKSSRIERFGNFGSVGFDCRLDSFKLNDSLIKDSRFLTIYK